MVNENQGGSGQEPVPLKDDPSGEAAFFDILRPEDEVKRSVRLKNDRQEQDNRLSKHYARRAYRFAKIWVGFLVVFIPAQMALNWFGHGLSDKAFMTVVGSLTVSILGFWFLVGRYLFPGNPK